MTGDYSRTPQGSSGSGGLSGSTNGGANSGADQNGAFWSGQSQYPPSQYSPSQYSPSQYSQPYPGQYAPYDGQRAFAVTAAPQQPASASGAQGTAYDAPYDAPYDAGNAAGNVSSSADAASSAEGAILGRLVIRPLPSEPGGQTREVLLDGHDVSIGRSPACNIVLDGDQLVSRRHALLRYNGSQYTVVDLGSSNGTFVNEVEIHGNTPLSDGDLITIGEHEVLYSMRPTRAAQGATLGSTAIMPPVSPGVNSAVSAAAGYGGMAGGQIVEMGGSSGPAYSPGAPAYGSPSYGPAASTSETAPQLAPGSLEAAQLVDIGAVPTLMELQANPPAQPRPEPAWSQQAQMFFAQQPSVEQPSVGQPAVSPAESEMPYSAMPPQMSPQTPPQISPGTPQQLQQAQQPLAPQASPPTPYSLPSQAPQAPQAPQLYGPPPSVPNAYQQQAEPSYAAQASGNVYGAYAGPPSNQPPLQAPGSAQAQPQAQIQAQIQAQPQGQPQAPQLGTPSGGLASSSHGALYQGPNTSSAHNTTAYLRAVRAQLDEANQRLAQVEEEESQQAEQRNAALLEVRTRLSAILSEQGGALGYSGGYGQTPSVPANANMANLIVLARQTAENPNHVSYMMQLAAHAGEIASALENAQNTSHASYASSGAFGPTGAANSGLLAQLDVLRARIDQLMS